MKQAWFAIVLGGILLTLLASPVPCRSQENPPENNVGNAEGSDPQSPAEILAAMSRDQPLLSEIVIPPLPDAMTGPQDPNMRKIVELFDELSSLKDRAFDVPDVFGDPVKSEAEKSASVAQGTVKPRAGCKEHTQGGWKNDWCKSGLPAGFVSCHFYRYDGSLCEEFFDDLTPSNRNRSYRLDGTSGATTYHTFVVQSFTRSREDRYFLYEHNQHIEHSDLEKGYVDGPWDSWEFLVEGEATLYTPYGEADLSTLIIKHKHHRFDWPDRKFYQNLLGITTFHPNDTITSGLWCMNLDTKELYQCYFAHWDTKDGKGSWYTRDKDGQITGSGEWE